MTMRLWYVNRRISNDSDIVDTNDCLNRGISGIPLTVKGDIYVTDTQLRFDIDVAANTAVWGCNYVILKGPDDNVGPVIRAFVDGMDPVASSANVMRLHCRRDTVKDGLAHWFDDATAVNHMDGVFSALPSRTLETRLMVKPTTMYEATRTFLSDNVLPDGIFFVQVTAVETSGNDDEYADYVQYWTLVYGSGTEAKPGTTVVPLAGDSAQMYTSPDLYDIVNNIDDLLPNVTAESIVDISVSKRSPLHIRSFTFNYGGVDQTAYTIVNLLQQYLTPTIHKDDQAPMYMNCFWCSKDANPMVKNTSDSLQVDETNVGWEITYTRDSTFRDVSGVYIYGENNVEICEIPPEFFDSNNQVKLRIIPRLDLMGIYTDVKIGPAFTTVYTIPEGHLPHTGSAWKTYQHDQMNLDRELMNLNIDRTKADAVLGASQSLVSGVMIGGLTSGPAAAASSAVGIAGNVASAYMNIDTIRKEQSAQEANVRRLNGSSFNAGYGTGYIRTSRLYGNCRISEHRPYGVTSTDIARYVKDNGYPAVGYRTVDIGQNTTGYIRGIAKRLWCTYLEDPNDPNDVSYDYQLTNAELMRDFNARLSRGVKLITQESDI